jgi:CDP-diacylglycerol---glycerol-3-phosphate 3-phosphatidyltransferase
MISVYQVKPYFQRLLMPVLRALHGAGLTPNFITLAALLLSLAGGIGLWLHPYGLSYLLLPLILLFRMALNALDGMMARTYNMQSRTGEVLNELGDVVSDLFLFIPLALMFSLGPFVFTSFLLLSVISEFTGVLGKAVAGVRRYEGPMGKSDRALLAGVFSLIMYFTDITAYADHVFWVANLLLVISIGARVMKTIKAKT